MVFSSVPGYLDPPKWHQEADQQAPGMIPSDPLQILPAAPTTGGSGGNSGGGGSGGPGSIRPGSMVDRARLARLPLPEAGLKCPRCDSSNTKFCYFNNYSLSQPRHFCKTCRRYWTRGGALRNVPVGGGCRRNKRSKGRNNNGSKTPVAVQKRGSVTCGGGNIVSSSTNTITNDLNSQVLMPPQPTQPFPFLPGLHHLNEYVSDFALNLRDGGGGCGAVEFGMGASSSGVSRVQQLSNLLAGSDITGNGLYPFHEAELDHTSGLGQMTRVKMEENHGLNLSKSIMLGIQGNDDQYNSWGSGNAWTDISGFHGSSSAGHLL